MNVKTALCAFLILALSFPGFAQKVTRSRQVPGLRTYDTDLAVMSKEEKDSVRMVTKIWKNYIKLQLYLWIKRKSQEKTLIL